MPLPTLNEQLAERIARRDDRVAFKAGTFFRRNDNGTLGFWCRTCERKSRDRRYRDVRAFWSSCKVSSFAEGFEWWQAHRCTDMHRHYAAGLPGRFEFRENYHGWRGIDRAA